MALSLTLADLGDGTGVLASVTGADSSTTVTFYAIPADANIRTPLWTSYGTRSGDGTLTLALAAPGYWWVYCAGTVSGVAALSPVGYTLASAGTWDVQELCLQAVVARLRQLVFNGTTASPGEIPGDRIFDYLIEAEQYQTMPYLCVWPGDEREDPLSDRGDRYVVPVEVGIFDELAGAYSDHRPKIERFRRQIEQAFSVQPLPGVSAVYLGTAKPGRLTGRDVPARGHLVSRVTLLFSAYLLRGLTGYANG